MSGFHAAQQTESKFNHAGADIMTIIAIDLQPQCRFSCFAANDQQCIHQPEQIVPELNNQARLAHKRVLIENVSAPKETLCASHCTNEYGITIPQNHFVFVRENYLSIQTSQNENCHGAHLLRGLPCPADYDHAIEVEGEVTDSACFHDKKEYCSTGLVEWLHAQEAETIIIGGLATEHSVLQTAAHLSWYNDNWHVIVNLSACRGYTPESAIKAVYTMRQAGVTVVSSTEELQAAIENGPATRVMRKVS
ncbi:isochorismatase family protein [Neisseria sp. MVDL18-041461]|uniref:isochorismatase family protein n=1 Tax=Neisseria sp. MVDL18-041461 TaxID=3061168 RepID=UPI00265FC7D5|nr:isochorismatase family protein [Neisseria sp. MVDL18-041461]MDO1516525.1 isochorismatase family protein [Neisseria sp. MVDL18-041461]